MTLQKEFIKKTLYFSIYGIFENQEEENDFLQVLANIPEHVKLVQITFFDAKMLPYKIVEKLEGFGANHPFFELKIYVLRRNLSSYLIKLGITNTFIPGKNLKTGPFCIKSIAIGGSADSLNKIFAIIEAIPDSEISIFIVQHILEDSSNLLESLLRHRTKLRVSTPENETLVERRNIYIAPSGYQMKVYKNRILLTKEPPVNYARPSIEVLFRSLSENYKEGLLAIVLSGYGSDGCKSLGFLKENKSKIIVEDPEECQAKELPRNCIETNNIDLVLKVPGIITFILENLQKFSIQEKELKEFLAELFVRYGYDFQNYQMDSIKRRIQLFMLNTKMDTFQNFKEEILAKPDYFEDLLLDLSVHVTDFFRDPPVFKVLNDKVYPYLNSFAHIKIWCVGCSNGMEAYSLAIHLDEMGILDKVQIYATDINPYVIEEAKNGLYSGEYLERYRNNYCKSGGSADFDKYFDIHPKYIKIKDYLKTGILFFQHSIVNSGVLNEFQLILCRNVLIYFNKELQQNVLKLFHESLDRSGFLVLGDKEDISINEGTKYFSVYHKEAKIFKKINSRDKME